MNRNLVHSLVVMTAALWASQSQMSMAQTGADTSPGRLYIVDVRHPSGFGLRSAAETNPTTERPAGTLGPKKTKAYQFRSIDYPGASLSGAFDSNGKIIVGDFSNPGVLLAFYLKGTTYYTVNIPGSQASILLGINTPGQMVGSYSDSQGVDHGLVYDGKNITTFDPPGSIGTRAWDISDSGVIVGDYFDSPTEEHGFVDKDGGFTTLDFPGAIYTSATGINSSGEIVGFYTTDGVTSHGFLLRNGVTRRLTSRSQSSRRRWASMTKTTSPVVSMMRVE